ncbi:MAG TPA: helix-turn-helix domain-containing protein [Solirubrobacteraceae bacterium]|nr:helix-turn-helix domain-containing protein [Solirubrobacteraceae bacterium]
MADFVEIQQKIDEHPWRGLPPEIAPALRPSAPDVAEEMLQAVITTVAAYSRPLEGEFGESIRAGVRQALDHFLAEIAASGEVPRPDVYRALGEGEQQAGRSLDSLLSAYRIGARVAWRRFSEIGAEAGLDPETLFELAESIFAYIDLLSAESAQGHAAAQSAAAGEQELRRRRLVRVLVRDPPPDPETAAAAAAEARWQLPRSLAAVAIGGDYRELVRARLPTDVIADTIGDVVCALVPDPDGPGRRSQLERAVRAGRAQAGLGTTVRWQQAGLSFARARAALGLAGASPELVSARDNAGRLLLGADRGLAADLAANRLAPLRELSPGSRRRLQETLAAWLAEQGRLGRVAERLGVHPQTARYRLGRLRDLFGSELDDPDARFWLELALRVDGSGGAG